MQKVIDVKDFLIELNNLLEIAKANAIKREIDGKERELLNLAETTDKIFSLYMQKMADMSREELQELLQETNAIIVKAMIYNAEDEELKEINKLLEINEEKKQLIKLVNPKHSKQEYDLIIDKVFRTIIEINPEIYPIYRGSQLLNSKLTDLIKFVLSSEEGEDGIFLNTDFSLFLPFIHSNKTFEKHHLEIRKNSGIVFSMPYNYDVIKLNYVIEQVIDYITYKYPDITIKMLVVPSKDEIPDINFSNVEKLINLIIENYITIALNLKKKPKPSISKISKLTPKIKKYIRENIEILEDIADTLIEENFLGISMYNKEIVEELTIPQEIKEFVKNDDLIKDLLVYGLSYIKEALGDFLLEYPSEEITDLIRFVVFSSVETELDEDLYVALETLEALFDHPYISKEYDYSSLEQAYKIIELHRKEDENNFYLFYKLRYLYLSEKYEEFLKEYENIEGKDDFLEILNIMAKYFTGILSKEEVIKEFQKFGKNYKHRKQTLDTVIAILNNNKKEMQDLLDKMDIDETLDVIYIYPYEPKLYEELELEYEYKPKEKRF